MINWRLYVLPAFLFVAGLAILLIGSRILTLGTAYEVLAQAPLGQSVGPRDAKVTIVEFTDYRCTPCRTIYPLVKQVEEKHPDVRFVFRNMPLSIPSILENRLALAAGMQGKFMAVHDMLMQREDPVTEEQLDDVCHKQGLDCGAIRRELRGKTVTENLNRTIDYARVLGINSAPTFLVDKEIYRTNKGMPTMENFEDMIAKAKGEAVDEEEPAKPRGRMRRNRPRRLPPLRDEDEGQNQDQTHKG
ncbi:MAG TPA: thioredoxin domain-containing protein [Patescibacteria group bacterium]|jgi:protein-disulfide isomerase|nr:thioredoxin domain-containing protein [Patescibacteria group bacterium]